MLITVYDMTEMQRLTYLHGCVYGNSLSSTDGIYYAESPPGSDVKLNLLCACFNSEI